LPDAVGYVVVGDERDSLGEGQRLAFSLGMDRCFPPSRQQVETLFGLTLGSRILGVHVEAERNR